MPQYTSASASPRVGDLPSVAGRSAGSPPAPDREGEGEREQRARAGGAAGPAAAAARLRGRRRRHALAMQRDHGAKLSILDVRCKDRAGTKFVVEMQLIHVAGFINRVIYNGCKAYADQLKAGESYTKLTDVVAISICDFELWPDAEQDAQKLPRVPMLSRWFMTESISDHHRLTVNLPGPLYERLARRATRTHRTIEAELVDAVATLPDEHDELPADMAEAIAALHLLGDEELWRAARQRLAPEKSSEIEELHRKRQRDGLSASELEALATLMKEYTRIMLVRSRSAALLKQRGHDVSELCAEHEP